MRPLYFLFFLSVALMISGCTMAEWSDDLDQEEIWAKFELFYNQEGNETVASGYFRKEGPEGPFVFLSHPSTVFFEGDTLEREDNFDYDYRRSFSRKIMEGEFSWVDYYGEARTFFARMTPVAIPGGIGDFRYGNDYQIYWDGPPLKEGEEIRASLVRAEAVSMPITVEDGHCPSNGVLMRDEMIIQQQVSVSIKESGANHIVIGKDDLRKISPHADGERYLYLDRIYKHNLSFKRGQNGEVYSTYRDVKKISITY